jgi:type IV secretion system protein VirD4
MSARNTPASGVPGWGPSHQTRPGKDWSDPREWLRAAAFAGVVYVFMFSGWPLPVSVLVVGVVGGLVAAVNDRLDQRSVSQSPTSRVLDAGDPITAVHAESARLGGGAYLGADGRGGWRLAGPEGAVLILGPPRSGKTSGVLIPAVLAHTGPVVSASTKPDVLRATIAARSRVGRVWQFDPTGSHRSDGAESLRWSPVPAARSWDGALMMARAIVSGAGVGAGTTDGTHWSKRATALFAGLLHAAAIDHRNVDSVVDWVLRHEIDEPGAILESTGAKLACGVLTGLANTEARERSSIFSAAADALDAYTSQGALNAAADPNFDADRFVRSGDTIYVHATGEHQALAAPLVCGVLADVRRATYHAHRTTGLGSRVLLALDEVANIAPIAELPQIVSEGGGQGLTLIAALQDLSQARARWGAAADGFLTLFASKLILPGIADTKTLEAVSVALGEYDRQLVSTTNQGSRLSGQASRTISTQRQRVLPAGDVANIPTGPTTESSGTSGPSGPAGERSMEGSRR